MIGYWQGRLLAEVNGESPHTAMLAELGFDPKAEGEYSLTLSNDCTVGFVFDEPSPAKSKRTRKAV
jgi:hypothetical protein